MSLTTDTRRPITLLSVLAVIAIVSLTPHASAQDLFIRDNTGDTGVEPNPSLAPMWLSPDIWVSNDGPMPGWNPAPYLINTPPQWMIPDPIPEDPDYRSPLSGQPNWVYVRVRNRGTVASTGNERLRLYWASASTGLVWDPQKLAGSFIDNVQNNVLFGAEITKERKSAANATQKERSDYIAAIIKIASDPALVFPNGGDSYWHTQQEIHRFGPMWRHGFTPNPTPANPNPDFIPSVAFLPWHREFVNRYEGLLQEANPTVKLLYWNWNSNPQTGPFNFFTSTFMGASGAGQPAGVPIGAPLSPAVDPLYPNMASGGMTVLRRLENIPINQITRSDTTVVNRQQYDATDPAQNFAGDLEGFSHNNSHFYIAGYWGPQAPAPFDPAMGGDQLLQPLAARDPFFFLLHAKVDELWARWQRKSVANLDPTTTYGTAQNHQNIAVDTLGPWDGTAFPDGLPNDNQNSEIEPWTQLGGQAYAKTALDHSVTSPPFYDTAPLLIPVLQPNQEVVLEIPWYPPDPEKFGNIDDPQHVCLIARIETTNSSPWGMKVAETASINFNTQQNNNIAWKNVSIIDTIPGPFKSVKVIMRNVFREPVAAGLLLGTAVDRVPADVFERGTFRIELPREVHQRWVENGGKGRGFELPPPHDRFLVRQPDATIEGIPLKPGEEFPVRVTYELKRDYRPTKRGEFLTYDIMQLGAPGNARAVVGGQRYQIDLEKLTPVKAGAPWRYLPGTRQLPATWAAVEFDDSRWYTRRLDLGLTDMAECDLLGTSPTTTYFRHAFNVDDPTFFRNLVMRIKSSDSARVQLNGREVYRTNLPDGPVNARTLARGQVHGIAREAFFPVKIEPTALRKGRNVLAVEVHQAAGNHRPPTFDLELDANWQTVEIPPAAGFLNVFDGQLMTVGKTVPVDVDAIDEDGTVRSVAFVLDNQAVQTVDRAPFRFNWKVTSGSHRLTAVITDNAGLQTKSHITLTGVANVPPNIQLIQPAPYTQVLPEDPVVVVARATDSDGTIARVDFFVKNGFRVGGTARLVGSATAPPFTVTIPKLDPGHNMLTAVAYDNGGARTAASNPAMIMVMGENGHTAHCANLSLPVFTDTTRWRVTEVPSTLAGVPAVPYAPVATTIPNTSNGITAVTTPGASGPPGQYTYAFNFCLCQGFSNPVLQLKLATDNESEIRLNGNVIGTTPADLSPATVTTGPAQAGFFVAGQNTLTVRVRNRGTGSNPNQATPTGLGVTGTLTATNGQCP